MIIQPNQQQPSHLVPSTQVQVRQSLALKQLDQNSQQIMGSSQPLSPTHTSTSNNAQQQSIKLKDGGRQREIKGLPSIVGLTTIEYALSDKIDIEVREVIQEDIQQNYLSQIYEESDEDYPFKTLSEQFSPHETYKRIEVTFNLPYQMTIEHIELQVQKTDTFKNYLKLLKVESAVGHQQTVELIHLKSAFFDTNKKQLSYFTPNRVIEMNMCGISQQIKMVFLYLFKKKPSAKKLREMKVQKKERMFSKTLNVSEKIKNEILPLLNGSDEDIDELDDEVAMISNKKGNDNIEENDCIQMEDIKVEIKGQKSKVKQQNASKQGQLGTTDKNNKEVKNSDDAEETRNFNTFPRNYSQSNNNNSSYNNDITSELVEQQLANNDLKSHQNSTNFQMISQNEQSCYIEQEIFGDNHDSLSEVQKLIYTCLPTIKITGFNCNQIQAITSMTYFINQSFLLKQKKHIQEAFEYDFMSGVLMISTKRFVQAVEVFRKIQSYYLQRIKVMSSQREQSKGSQVEMKKIFIKCSILELLSAESMSSPNQISDKLSSLMRMVDLFQGKQVEAITFTPQNFSTEDSFTIMIKILPTLLKFIIMCLTHKKEIIRMSSLKLLEFILETQGCSLDQSMVFILKAILKTYPTNWQQELKDKTLNKEESFSVKGFTQSVQDYFQYQDSQQHDVKNTKNQGYSEYKSIKEPTSGFNNALKNAYNHALDTYISVLSSISSHILHQLFYEVIIPTVTNSSQDKSISDIKIFAVKIAEKIITICQGDLILSKPSLEFFIVSTGNKASQSPSQSNSINTNNSESLQLNIRNLWQSIRTKVFTNYSQKGLKTLIEWLVDKMSLIAQNAQSNNPQQVLITESSGNQDISKLEITDDDSQQLLQLFDIVSMISVGRKNNEAEANSLIKIKQEYCLELYLLINPLLFWLDFSVEREERFPLFKSIYSTIKDVLDNLPSKRVDIDLLQIMIPILQRTTEFLKNNSPSLQMLKFLDIVLRDLKQGGYCQQNPDLQYFFLDMLNNFVGYISYCLYEEVFAVFDKLMALCADVVNEKVLTKCIVAMVDKYTIKSKAHKNSLTIFMKVLMEVKVRSHNKGEGSNRAATNSDEELDDDQISVQSKNNYFEILCDFCFFNNKDSELESKLTTTKSDFKSPLDHHDLYIDKLQFFVDSLSLLTEIHVNLFTSLITHPNFKQTLLTLLTKGETSLRLKCHEILETVANYYVQHCTSKTVYKMASSDNKKQSGNNEVMEVEYVNHERLYLSQLVLQCVRRSLDQANDSYLQFNSLILLDFLFQNLLPVPTYQNEIQKERINKSSGNSSAAQSEGIIELESLEINEKTPEFEVTATQYTNLRLDLILKLWPQIQIALNSAWSNIRSICYGLICSMFKIDVKALTNEENELNKQQAAKLKQIVLPMLQSLLSSKESESKAGGLNILGSFCGLSYDFSKVKISKNMEFFKKNSSFISLQIWQLVFDLQDDWDITIKEASVVLIQLCAPRDAITYFDKLKKDTEDKKFNQMLQRYGLGQNGMTGGDQSSRMSSARGDHQYMMQHSVTSNEEVAIKKSAHNGGTNQNTNILSFLSNDVTDEMSMAFQMDQQQQQQLSENEIFDHIGNTINSAHLMGNFKNTIDQRATIGPLNDKEEERKEQFELDDKQKKVVNDVSNMPNAELFEFFVDTYQDDQIQEIISIFRNDFKPPKNLWIEKNQSANGFNAPDYYSEIFSSAIDQFNQNQMQLQQQQQQQQQQMVNNSPKNVGNKIVTIPNAIVDALEDDIVNKYDKERKEKELQNADSQITQKQSSVKDNYMIFERNFEDGEDKEPELDKVEVSEFDGKKNKSEAELSPQLETVNEKEQNKNIKQNKKGKKSKEEKKKSMPANQLSLSIVDENENKFYHAAKQDKITENQNQPIAEDNNKTQKINKKTTDELIEEYEKKISKTKKLLEEEKKKSKSSTHIYDTADFKQQQDLIVKQTPDFKSKKETSNLPLQKGYDDINHPISKSSEKILKKSNIQQNYVTELPKSYMPNIDNAKLIKQINNCFNDNSFNNFNIGPVVMTNNYGSTGNTKQKQKLNKSFENILAANKHSLKQNQDVKYQSKKNQSTSPKRGSSSGKKSGSLKGGVNCKKKYLDKPQQQPSKTQPKALYNMKDLNYFIKTIEKDLSDKFNKLNMKDFNSMPTTPTSILKKVEDQMKAISTSQGNVFNKQDIKTQMSNTCPNMAQVLNQLDPLQQHYPHNQAQKHQAVNSNILQISHPKMNGAYDNHQKGGHSEILQSHNHTPSNISKNGISNMIMAQSQNSLSNYSIGNQLDKFSFSKTQRIDLKDTNKNLFGQKTHNGRDGQTTREYSNENQSKKIKRSPIIEQRMGKTPKVLNHKTGLNKRSRGSQDKYLTTNQIMNTGLINNPSGTSSQSKLNKSLNNISSISTGAGYNSKKKEQLSKSMINNFAKVNNMSPNNKKLMQQMIQQQLNGTHSQATTHMHQTPAHTQQNMTNQYSYSSNLLYDYIQNSDQNHKKHSHNVKTPIKTQGIKTQGKVGNYSEIMEMSPSSAEKEIRYYARNIL